MLLFLLAPLALVTGLLLGLLQGDPMDSPIIVALLSLLAVPVVASAITTGLIRATGWGMKPQSIVYIVCGAIITGLAWLNGGVPLVDAANPVGTAIAWQVWIAAQSEYTKMLYDLVFKRIWPSDPAPVPLP